MKLTLLAFLTLLVCTAKIAVAQDYWQKINTPDSLSLTDVMVDNQGSIFISSWNNFNKGGVYRSDDDGYTWLNKNNGLPAPNQSILALATDSYGAIFAGVQNGILKSLDNGDTWLQVYHTPIHASNMYVIRCGYDSIIVAGGENQDGIIRSGDNGLTWQKVLDISHNGYFESITDIQFGPDGVIYACSRITMSNDPGMIYASYDQGRTWNVFCEAGYPMALGFDNYGRLLKGEFGSGLYRYDFNTSVWEHILATGVSPQEILTVPDNKIFLGCNYWPSGGLGGAMVSTNGGESFSFLNSGFGLSNNASEFAIDLIGRILTVNGAIFRSYDTIFTSVKDINTEANQLLAYPNPFHGNVTITFPCTNGNDHDAKILIFNSTGQLVHQSSVSNRQEYIWDGSNFPGGIYSVHFYNRKSTSTVKVLHF